MFISLGIRNAGTGSHSRFQQEARLANPAAYSRSIAVAGGKDWRARAGGIGSWSRARTCRPCGSCPASSRFSPRRTSRRAASWP